MTVIKADKLTKIYKLQEVKNYDKEKFKLFKKKSHQDFYALKDVSFEVEKGEVLGIIGVNGSGKSTLLKILTGVLKPTSGEVKITGKISSILELGAGFNHEYTGMENIYFSGAVLGFTKSEIDSRLEQIIAFADIGDFINQPVKVYSSGMFVRLAFAIAANVESDILIIDEALAVGDVKFAFKCINHMNRLVEQGVTIILVTHDTQTIKSFCKRAIWLHNGEIKLEGDTLKVASQYIRFLFEHELKADQDEIEIPQDEPEDSDEAINQDLELKRDFHIINSNDWYFQNTKGFDVQYLNDMLIVNSSIDGEFFQIVTGGFSKISLPADEAHTFYLFPETYYSLLINIESNIKMRVGIVFFSEEGERIDEKTYNFFNVKDKTGKYFLTPSNVFSFRLWIEFFGKGKAILNGIKLSKIDASQIESLTNELPPMSFQENGEIKVRSVHEIESILLNKINLSQINLNGKGFELPFNSKIWNLTGTENIKFELKENMLSVNSGLGDGLHYIWTGGGQWVDSLPENKETYKFSNTGGNKVIILGKFNIKARLWVFLYSENGVRSDRIFDIPKNYENELISFDFKNDDETRFFRIGLEFIGNGEAEIESIKIIGAE